MVWKDSSANSYKSDYYNICLGSPLTHGPRSGSSATSEYFFYDPHIKLYMQRACAVLKVHI